jgi:hypothetical protein
VPLVELVAFNGATVELTCWKQAQFEGLTEIFAVTALKKKRLLQSQTREPLADLLHMQLDASRPTGHICLVCMY